MIENIEFKNEIILGIFAGLMFILFNVATGYTIGIPLLAFAFDSDTQKYIISDGIAPTVEELAFRGLFPFILAFIGVPFILNLFINGIGFSAFHYVVYGSSLVAASSLFIGAFVFAVAAFLLTYYKSNPNEFQVPISAIIMHIAVNTWLGIKALSLIVVGVNV